MGSTLRALRALVLLLGFYLVGLVLLGALGALDWWIIGGGHFGAALKIVVVSGIVAIPILRGMFAVRSPRFEPPADGLRVEEHQEPRLWAAVRRLAEQAGTRGPDEIYLVPHVNAAVYEQVRLLGLFPGRRVLLLGAPLLTGLDEAQLTGVLAHEFGHYAHADPRLGAIDRRGFERISLTVGTLMGASDARRADELRRSEAKQAARLAKGKSVRQVGAGSAGISFRLAARPFLWYGSFYVRVMRGSMRRQEYAADLAAARIAGRDATASALREIPVLDAAFDLYMSAYATLGVRAGLLPPQGEVYGGLGRLLDARSGELDALRAELPDEQPSGYDTHPPIAERVARIEQLPDDGRGRHAAGPALGLLVDPAAAFTALEQAALTSQALGLRRAADWPQLVHESMTVYATGSAEPLRQAVREATGGDGSADSVLAAIEAGALWQLAERLPRSPQAAAATGRAARELARPQLRDMLSHLVVGELIARGRAHFELSWTGSAVLRLAEDRSAPLEEALDAAVADVPDTAPLRGLLAPVA
ncbi:M48 family metalloprotease [Streptomyces sp. SID5785]|uniref:M48 family metalloprotease n=1 Tax=Streptomyces sp. SID5785 TaxID=2690309 RepID=UPI001361CDF7|nr:M48 family metallopeptidase [Streptomyces sp. SID5785]MZD05367.1 M48 family metalloprotease [Streptomyces sp. SID5785]